MDLSIAEASSMIAIQCLAQKSLKAFDAAQIFAQQLDRLGHDIVLDETTVPDDLDRGRHYEAAPFLADLNGVAPDRLVLLGAEALDAKTLDSLRFGTMGLPKRIDALGRFASLQAKIDAETKLSYALGQNVVALDLSEMQGGTLLQAALSPLFGEPLPARPESMPVVQLYVEPESLDDALGLPTLEAMSYSNDFRLEVIIAGVGKSVIGASRANDIKVYAYSELPPFELSTRADILIIHGVSVPGERMAQHAVNMITNARPVIDCTADRVMASEGLPVIAGPGDPAALAPFLEARVLPELKEIKSRMLQSKWVRANTLDVLCERLDFPVPEKTPSKEDQTIVMMPTNGTGLGHARRTLLVSKEIASAPVSFAAFPSCVPLIHRAGFACDPLVSKSDEHSNPIANDVLNYTRLRRILRSGDTLVFDGGYVFDSILRTLAETQARAIWIRRGLWLASQKRDATLEREKAFQRVIVPEEAFADLNEPLTFGRHVRSVGPVVATRSADVDAVRADLSERFDRPIGQLVVSMLGGGAASDRTAQAMHLAALAERRNDLLHLSVAWPGAVVAPGLFGWTNTRVVQTQDALSLALAADFVVSAVGYNGFHECLYNAIPALFVPQIAPFMDDQERRARAAVDRGLAALAMPGEMAKFERLFTQFLDGYSDTLRGALSKVDLPERGNAAAARLIEEVAHDRT